MSKTLRMRDVYPTVKLICRLFNSHKRWLFLGVGCIVISSLLIIPMPMLTRRLIDNTLPGKDMRELLYIVALLTGLLFFLQFIDSLRRYIFARINNQVLLRLRVTLLSKVARSPMTYVSQYDTGYFISRITDDTSRLESVFLDELIDVLNSTITLFFGLFMIFYLQSRLAWLCLALIPPFVLSSIIFGKKIRQAASLYFETHAKSTEALNRSLSLIEICKIYNRLITCALTYFVKAKHEYKSLVNYFKLNIVFDATIGLISGLSPIIVLFAGGYLTINGEMTIGTLVAFNAFAGYLFGPVNKLTQFKVTWEKAFAAITRVHEMLNLPQEIIPRQDETQVNTLQLSNVDFGYSSRQILKGVNFFAKKGQIVGLCGPSGAGKTTFLRIISGLYPPQSGDILLNQRSLASKEYTVLRHYTAYVPIDPTLIDGTLREQLTLANVNLGQESLELIVAQAGLTEFIRDLPDRYRHLIKRGGSNLSSGQRQRVMLATALAKSAQVLILDEALVNLDNTLKRKILGELVIHKAERITILVSHDSLVLDCCDTVYSMNEGTITLLTKNP